MKNMQAVRVFRKLWNSIAESQAEAERCDAGFDGGEFSGPFHARMEEKMWGDLLKRVATAYGISATTLENSVLAADNFWQRS